MCVCHHVYEHSCRRRPEACMGNCRHITEAQSWAAARIARITSQPEATTPCRGTLAEPQVPEHGACQWGVSLAKIARQANRPLH